MNPETLWRRATSEWLGTFALVFAGCGAAGVDTLTGGALGPWGVGAVFGLVVFCAIETVGPTGGAHLNPAVTVAFALSGRLAWRDVPAYAAAQCGGAVVAAALLAWLLGPDAAAAGVTAPNAALGIDAPRAAGLEAVLTCGLMTVILAVATGPKEKGLLAGLAIGGAVAVAATAFGPVCGASMNPARSLGPAVAAGNFAHLWAYLAGPLAGAAAAVPVYRTVRPAGLDDAG